MRFRLDDNALTGLTLTLDGQRSSFGLVGEFNAYNLAAAYSVGVGMGWEASAVRIALEGASSVPGRFEQFVTQDDRTIIVDYAHTPDALENVLRTARATMDSESRTPVGALRLRWRPRHDQAPPDRSDRRALRRPLHRHVR